MTPEKDAMADLNELREKAALQTGPKYWRSLEELAQTDEFKEKLDLEFPMGADVFNDPAGRRRFLQIMGASLALAGVTGCTRQPKEFIAPYAANPPEQMPGAARHFATVMPIGGYGEPVVVESHENRPTKVSGNPEHPVSGGATSIYAQTSVLDMYDPDRLKTVIERGRASGWSALLTELRREMTLRRAEKGKGLRVLTGSVGSPTLGAKLQQLVAELPEAKWHQWEPAGRDSARAASMAAFGEAVETRHDLSKAKVILSLDADFLNTNAPGSVQMVRDFARGRKVADGDASGMNRLYVVEPSPTTTGSNADHRLRLRACDLEIFAFALAAELGLGLTGGELPEKAQAWLAPLAKDLQAAGSSAVVIAGDQQPESVHRIAAAINGMLGAFGSTVIHTDTVEVEPVDQAASLAELVADMNAGEVQTLIILGGNPVYSTPGDVDFAAALDHVPFRLYSNLHDDETGYLCHWQTPATHYLESWGDARAVDGTVSIQQPLIEPLYQSKSDLEIVSLLLGDERSGHDVLREAWAGLGDEKAWRKALHDGMIEGSAFESRAMTLGDGVLAGLSTPEFQKGVELTIRPDASTFDGRFANNGWLQELPKPISRITWENVAVMSPATAKGLGFKDGEVLTLEAGGNKVQAPAWIVPGQADDAVTVTLGYGRTRCGHVAAGAGFDAYQLQSMGARWSAAGLGLAKAGKRTEVACVQDHASMEGRGLIQIAAASTYEERPGFAQETHHGPPADHSVEEPGVGSPFVGEVGEAVPEGERGLGFQEGRTQGNPYSTDKNPKSFYPEYQYEGNAWGMAIDLNACVGCNACMAACQSENNLPVVGKEQVALGREMHWIRIDRYFEGAEDDPSAVHQPVTCMQCEKAPCEPVCPVGATVHSAEGLNDMVYNRCVGTRYCSNNCPYKVRRFNFLLYQDFESETLKMARNPDVTVRSRGVMEKCTYCVQRINEVRIASSKEQRPIEDGEIQTACQQVCPAEAITFGDINDPASAVAKAKADSRNYALLEELNTQPRTTYLARVLNPNPEMPSPPAAEGEHDDSHGAAEHSRLAEAEV